MSGCCTPLSTHVPYSLLLFPPVSPSLSTCSMGLTSLWVMLYISWAQQALGECYCPSEALSQEAKCCSVLLWVPLGVLAAGSIVKAVQVQPPQECTAGLCSNTGTSTRAFSPLCQPPWPPMKLLLSITGCTLAHVKQQLVGLTGCDTFSVSALGPCLGTGCISSPRSTAPFTGSTTEALRVKPQLAAMPS